MATRDGVEEYSTSPIAQRSSERSIRASWTTGYWGAMASIRASISTRFATTAATMDRASAPAAGSASTSARSRSRTAVAVRCPKSASNTADSATRRPARRLLMRSEGAASSRFTRATRHARAAGQAAASDHVGTSGDPSDAGTGLLGVAGRPPPSPGPSGEPNGEDTSESEAAPSPPSSYGTPSDPLRA